MENPISVSNKACLNRLVGTTYPTWLDFSSIKLFRLTSCVDPSGRLVGKPEWPSRKAIHDCNAVELSQANQRTLSPCEIVLDIESIEGYFLAVAKLKKDGIDHWAYRTNRGVHIHIFFEELHEKSPEERKSIRRAFCLRYNADASKISEDCMVALEYRYHWKSNRLKILIAKYGIVNADLPSWAQQAALQACVEDKTQFLGSYEPRPDASISEILARQPMIQARVDLLRGSEPPADASKIDFVILLSFVENGVPKDSALGFFSTLRHSKFNRPGQGLKYFNRTWENAVRISQERGIQSTRVVEA